MKVTCTNLRVMAASAAEVLDGCGARLREARNVIRSTGLRHGACRIGAKTQENHASVRAAPLHTSFLTDGTRMCCWLRRPLSPGAGPFTRNTP
jgi:hypothetical protein